MKEKVKRLGDWLRHYNGSCIVHAGAGISTAAGIRDFRGKKGVWTEIQQQQQVVGERVKRVRGEAHASCSSAADKAADDADNRNKPPTLELAPSAKPKEEKVEEREGDKFEVKPFDQTLPTCTHLALRGLCEEGLVKHIVSQNVDGLFLKANLKRKFISELHGNFYLDECTKCKARFIRSTASPTMRLQKSSVRCPRSATSTESGNLTEKTPCKGHLRDTILDWESPIPHNELRLATKESKCCRLHICIGTSMQLRPSKDLVCKNKSKYKLVIINLQPTQLDKHADLVIHYYADEVMKELFKILDLKLPEYNPIEDPTKDAALVGSMWKK